MIKIKKTTATDIEILALLGRVTWAESHGHYIADKSNLLKYLDENFSISKTTQELNNTKQHFYIIYVENLPIGYAKLIENVAHENVDSQNNCRLERIFILNDFIPLRVGKQLLNHVEAQAKAMQLDTMWLSVYIKNTRAIRFYEKNKFKHVGELNFIVNGNSYENIVFAKKLL